MSINYNDDIPADDIVYDVIEDTVSERVFNKIQGHRRAFAAGNSEADPFRLLIKATCDVWFELSVARQSEFFKFDRSAAIDALAEFARDSGIDTDKAQQYIAYIFSPHLRTVVAVADLTAVFTFLGDKPATPPRELIKKLLPAEGVAVTGGQSTAGKTFIEIHKTLCLAKPMPFFGHRIIERVGTAFVAAEGRALLPNRFAAALAQHLITEKLPIAWINQLPDFSTADGIKLFIRQMKALDEKIQG